MNEHVMQALLFDQPGVAEDVIRLGSAPVPIPAQHHVRIKVMARVLQPADRLFIAGRYRVAPRFPQVAGFDGAGVVDAIGPGVDASLLGRRVAFRSVGAWAAFAVAPVDRIHTVPDGIDLRRACQFTLNPLTAWGLLDVVQVTAGARVLVTAAHSSVARWIAALGLERGLSVTLAARNEAGWSAWQPRSTDRASARSLAELLHILRPDHAFHAVIDPIGGPGTLDLMDACAPGATLVSYGILDDRPFELGASRMLYRNLRWNGFGIDHFLDHLHEPMLELARDTIWRLMQAHPELTAIAACHPLREYMQALRNSTQLARQGKVLLVEEAA